MPQVLYLHWNKSEALATARTLRGKGFTVDYHSDATRLPRFRVLPGALVVSLERLPEQGRKVAAWFHRAKARTAIPVVFCGPSETHGAARKAVKAAHVCTPRTLTEVLERVAGTPRTKRKGKGKETSGSGGGGAKRASGAGSASRSAGRGGKGTASSGARSGGSRATGSRSGGKSATGAKGRGPGAGATRRKKRSS